MYSHKMSHRMKTTFRVVIPLPDVMSIIYAQRLIDSDSLHLVIEMYAYGIIFRRISPSCHKIVKRTVGHQYSTLRGNNFVHGIINSIVSFCLKKYLILAIKVNIFEKERDMRFCKFISFA